jgi:hypothetical protein
VRGKSGHRRSSVNFTNEETIYSNARTGRSCTYLKFVEVVSLTDDQEGGGCDKEEHGETERERFVRRSAVGRLLSKKDPTACCVIDVRVVLSELLVPLI